MDRVYRAVLPILVFAFLYMAYARVYDKLVWGISWVDMYRISFVVRVLSRNSGFIVGLGTLAQTQHAHNTSRLLGRSFVQCRQLLQLRLRQLNGVSNCGSS